MKKDAQERALGLAAAIAASVLGGAVIVATRVLASTVDPVVLAALRYVIGALLLVPATMLIGKIRITRNDYLPIAALGVLIFTLVPYLLNLGLHYTSATRGAIALSTLPLSTAVLAALLRIERLTVPTCVGVVLATIGVVTALSERDLAAGPARAWIGDLILIMTALLGSFYNLLVRPLMQRNGALATTACAMVAGVFALMTTTVISGQWQWPHLSVMHWSIVAFLGVFGAAANFWLWSYALSHTPPTQVAITTTLSPVTAGLLGWGLLGEAVSVRSLFGLAAVVLGIIIAVRGRLVR